MVNSRFIDNRCYKVGPDLGGAAIRAISQWSSQPVYITSDTFKAAGAPTAARSAASVAAGTSSTAS